MRTVSFTLVIIAVCACTLGCPHGAMDGGGHGRRNVCPTLSNTDGTPYTAVKTKPMSGHCDFTWDVDDGSLDNPKHPEIYLDADHGDTMSFESAGNFIYSIKMDIPAGVDESTCFASPVPFDAHANQGDTHHKPGKVQRNGNGPKKCHYKILFNKGAQPEKTAELDPHIVVGGK